MKILDFGDINSRPHENSNIIIMKREITNATAQTHKKKEKKKKKKKKRERQKEKRKTVFLN